MSVQDEESKNGKKNIFKISFNKKLVAKDNYISCRNAIEKRSWIRALKDYQIINLETRMKLFAK